MFGLLTQSMGEIFVRQPAKVSRSSALGRPMQDGDQCTVQKLVDKLGRENYNARMLVREIVLGTALRKYQEGAAVAPVVTSAPKRERPKLMGIK